MSVRSALAGSATAAAVVALLGSPAAADVASDADSRALAGTLTAFPAWDVADRSGEVVGQVALRLGVLVVVTGLLCAVAGRSRSRPAAGLAGWAALAVAAGLAGAAAHAYEVAVVLEGGIDAAAYVDGVARAVNGGGAFGVWTGWLVGLAVALVTRPARLPAASPAGAPPPPGRATTPADASPAPRIADPPPPWWAPTQAGRGDAAVRPGPSAFPPGGMLGAHPVAPVPPALRTPQPVDPDASYDMTTASGDPHPSDPDATRAIRPGDGEAAGSEAPGADTDVTETLDAPDRTRPLPRHDE
jgi:hypothetical protein